MRYLWDVYDNVNDWDGDDYSAGTTCYWCHLATPFHYGDGFGTNEINEPWTEFVWGPWPSVLTNRDARGAKAYDVAYRAQFGNSTIDSLRIDNCTPP